MIAQARTLGFTHDAKCSINFMIHFCGHVKNDKSIFIIVIVSFKRFNSFAALLKASNCQANWKLKAFKKVSCLKGEN